MKVISKCVLDRHYALFVSFQNIIFLYIAELYTVLVSSQKLFKFSLIKDIYCVKCNLAFILVFFQGLLAMNNMRKRSLKRLREALSRTLESKIKQRISFTLGCSLNLKCDTISLGCVVLRRENIKDISQLSVMEIGELIVDRDLKNLL